jgi:hypothetical protein
LLIAVLVGKILDLSGSFPAAFNACAGFAALARARRLHPREGRRQRPVMVT